MFHEAQRPMKMQREGNLDGVSARDAQIARQAVEAEIGIATKIGEALQFYYPGHMWKVECELEKGWVLVSLPVIMPPSKRYVIYLEKLMDGPNAVLRWAKESGGHILELFNIPRSGIDFAHLAAARPQKIILPS